MRTAFLLGEARDGHVGEGFIEAIQAANVDASFLFIPITHRSGLDMLHAVFLHLRHLRSLVCSRSCFSFNILNCCIETLFKFRLDRVLIDGRPARQTMTMDDG